MVALLCFQFLLGCADSDSDYSPKSSVVYISENKIEENFVYEKSVEEELFSESFIIENFVVEEGIYECVVDEVVIAEGYYFEVTIGENSIEEIRSQLPEEIEDYDIDWTAVIAKFAVGTTVIVATGVVGAYVPSTYFVVASPIEVGAEAVLGGAISAALEVGKQEFKAGGDLPEEGIKKYAIEGFADGYMWGAITSVIRIKSKNLERTAKLIDELGNVLEILKDGTVKDAAGKVLGKAYWSENGIYLVKEGTKKATIELFDNAGKKIVNPTAEQLALCAESRLPKNALLALGEQVCRTDSEGMIYRIDNELVKNTTYKIDNVLYRTDDMGRIVEVSFDNLELKEAGRSRKVIADFINDIGKGNELPGDQRGHIIGDRFNGDNTLANMVPMSAEANQGEYKAIEDIWAEAISNNRNVSGDITFSYTNDSFRPDYFDVVYDIGDGLVTKNIVN